MQDNPYAKYKQQPRGVVIADPYRADEEARKQAEEQRRQQDQEFERRRVALAEQQAALSAQAADLARLKTGRDIAKDDLIINEKTRELASKPDPEMKRVQGALKTDSVLQAINTARRQAGEGYATGNVFGGKFFQGVPVLGQGSTNLSATLSGLQGSVINDTLAQLKEMSANGSSGYGSLSETEAGRLAAAVGALQQTQDADSLMANLAKVELHYRNALALLNNEDPRTPEVAAKYGITPPKEGNPTAGGLTSEGKREKDPALVGVNAKVDDMIRRGAGPDEVRSYLDAVQPGLGGKAKNVEELVSFSRQNPDYKGPFDIDLEDTWEPNNALEKGVGDFLMTPLGSGAVGAADTMTFGLADNVSGALSGNADRSRAVMGGLAEENPGSYLTGQILGGATSGLALEKMLLGKGLSSGKAMLAGDALYGAGYGAGSADDPGDSRVASALLGSAAGAAGGAVGRGVIKAGGRAVAGVNDAAQNLLHKAGVKMTPGQILGGKTKAFEDRLSGLPVVGDAIRARRAEGVQGFNVAAFDEALAPIGKTTGGVVKEEGVDIARLLRSQAYDDALSGVRVAADEPFIDDLAGTIIKANERADVLPGNIKFTLEDRVGTAFDDAGAISGNDYQQVLRGLRRDASSVEALPYGYDFGQVTRSAEDALEGLLERQSPGTAASLRTANEVNRNVETVRDAVNRARNGSRSWQPGAFMPSQLSDSAARSAKKYGNSQGTTNQPFFDLTRAGQEVLPSSIADSGTAGRLVLPALVGATAGGGAYATQDGEDRTGNTVSTAVIASLLASAPYSRSARNAFQKLMLEARPEAVQTLGEKMIEKANIAGLLARPGAVVAVAE